MNFKLHSDFKPTGDQPDAIEQLVGSIRDHRDHNVLLGVTGSGKTFTVANIIEEINRPTLVLSHNKTLAAQLYGEFKNFFPENAVEYFVSYYDYYQPEAYLPATNTYIEKDLSINQEIEKMRLKTTTSLLTGRSDIIVVSSVSCLYGIGNPEDLHATSIKLEVGEIVNQKHLLYALVDALYTRTDDKLTKATFRVNGEVIDIFPAYGDDCYSVSFYDDEIERIEVFEPEHGTRLGLVEKVTIFPANLFVTPAEKTRNAIKEIQLDLGKQIEFFESQGKHTEAQRIKQRVENDLEMMKEVGYCSGIENYSRYFDGRPPGSRPFCLIDYFPKDYLLVIDESHVTIPQIRAMYGGDRSRKENLVNYGYRLPAAIDNRPLQFSEFEGLAGNTIYISATPSDYEKIKSEGAVVEQLIRPTGIVDPPIIVKSTSGQIDDLLEEIDKRRQVNERVLVTTLTKKMAEELAKYFNRLGVPNTYIHSDIDSLERMEIIDRLREGDIDVLIGVNLLREGLDIPEVSLVVIMDADKEGFLRNERSLTQTAGRAARHVRGTVIMYADKITESMAKTISESNRRREKQILYNATHNVEPRQIEKGRSVKMSSSSASDEVMYPNTGDNFIAADIRAVYRTEGELHDAIERARKSMEQAARELNFIEAAKYRDLMLTLMSRGDKK